MSHVVSPVSDKSNNSYIMVDEDEEQAGDAPTTTSRTSQIQCSNCNALNITSADTCSQCNTTLASTAGTAPQDASNARSSLSNGPTIGVTVDSSDEDTEEEETEYSITNHLSAPDSPYPPEEQLFGKFFLRNLYTSTSLLLFCLFCFHLWFSKKVASEFQSAFNVAASGTFFIFLGAVCCILWIVIHTKNIRFPHPSMLQYITMILYFLGGILYFIGGCVLANAYNKYDHTSAYAGIWFCETSFVAIHAILSGIDLKKRILNTHGLRLVTTSVILLFLSAVMFFCCAIRSTALKSTIAGYGLQATGYFGTMILVPLFIVIKVCVTLAEKTQVVIDTLIMFAICVCLLFVVFGYLALPGDHDIDTDHLGGYWVGFGLFLLLHGIIIVMDIRLEKILPCKSLNVDSSLTESMLKKGNASYLHI
eukprot:197695_1